jgi:hypothetical protein
MADCFGELESWMNWTERATEKERKGGKKERKRRKGDKGRVSERDGKKWRGRERLRKGERESHLR